MAARRILPLLALALFCASTAGAQRDSRPLAEGDRLLIKLWTDSVFADTARLQHGSLVLPRLGPLPVGGVAAASLADSIRSAYSRVLTPAVVEVTPLRRITVLGEVGTPGVYFLEPGTTIREGIAVAGGITEAGRTGHVTVMRDSTSIRLRNWHARFDDAAILHSGDVVWVDRESWIKRNAFTVVSGLSVLLSIIITLSSK